MIVREDSGPRDAPAVVFVHGAGVAGWMWKIQMEAFPGMRAISVDLPDHGLAKGQAFRGLGEAADEIADFVRDGIPGGKAYFVGHSLGAKIVLEIALRRAEAAKGAVVSSALVRPMALVSMMNSHALNAMSLWMLKSAAVARMQAEQFAFPDPGMTESYLAEVRGLKAENLDRPIAAFAGSLFLPADLDRVKCPILVTAGSREPRAMRDSASDIAAAIPSARLAFIEGGRHVYPWTHYAAYDLLLGAFFAEKELSEGL